MSLDSYTNFASVYDTFMDQEPYGLWADRICALLEQYGLRAGSAEEAGIVVDLGCGTGKLTELLAARGYDMIGIDLSEDMLAIAQDRKEASGHDILYSLQDMRDFELYGAAGAMVSAGDSINYLLEEEGLEDMFRCVFRGLLPGGVFGFDFKTIHLYRDLIGDRTIAEDRGTAPLSGTTAMTPGPGSTNTPSRSLWRLSRIPRRPGIRRRMRFLHRMNILHQMSSLHRRTFPCRTRRTPVKTLPGSRS